MGVGGQCGNTGFKRAMTDFGDQKDAAWQFSDRCRADLRAAWKESEKPEHLSRNPRWEMLKTRKEVRTALKGDILSNHLLFIYWGSL